MTARALASPASSQLTVLAADVRLSGAITCDGELHIDGIVNGNIAAQRLTVGPDAAIIGLVQADDAWIGGTVHGDIEVATLIIGKSARIYADLKYTKLTVEPGAVMEPRRPSSTG